MDGVHRPTGTSVRAAGHVAGRDEEAVARTEVVVNRMIPRMRREYEHWPRLALTIPQAARLWSADQSVCSAAFRALVRVGFLAHRGDGRFVRRDQSFERDSGAVAA